MSKRITKDAAGVEALRKFASDLEHCQDETSAAANKLESAYGTVRSTIAHDEDVLEIIEDIFETNRKVASSVAELEVRLKKVSDRLEEFLSRGLGGKS